MRIIKSVFFILAIGLTTMSCMKKKNCAAMSIEMDQKKNESHLYNSQWANDGGIFTHTPNEIIEYEEHKEYLEDEIHKYELEMASDGCY